MIFLCEDQGVVAALGGADRGDQRGARARSRLREPAHLQGRPRGIPQHCRPAGPGKQRLCRNAGLSGERGLEQRFRLESEGVKFSGKKVRMKDFEFVFRAVKKRK